MIQLITCHSVFDCRSMSGELYGMKQFVIASVLEFHAFLHVVLNTSVFTDFAPSVPEKYSAILWLPSCSIVTSRLYGRVPDMTL